MKTTIAAILALAACSSSQPGDGKTYVLVHGAWMGSAGWAPVADELRARGADVHLFDLPAHGDDATPASTATLAGYVDRVSAELDAADRPVILVGHSMGGVVITEVADRRPADIARLVYVAAYLPRDGESLLDLAMSDADSQIGAHLEPHDDGTIGIAADAFPDLFCGTDCDDTARAALVAGYRDEPTAPLGTKVALTGGADTVAKTYVHTGEDRVVSPSLQSAMVAATPVNREVTLDASHAVLLSQPDALAQALLAD
jgi:pimeloyl-ACP methyl ester carboxylesterase